MNTIRKEVRDLITVNERIQSVLEQGDHLTEDETALIRICGNELLARIESTRETLA